MTTPLPPDPNPNLTLSTLHNSLLSYHTEISNQLPNPPSKHYLTRMSLPDLFSSLQLSIFMLTEMKLSTLQSQYESQLQQSEKQLRYYSRIRLLSKIQKEAMKHKLKDLLSQEDDLLKSKRQLTNQLNLKENELLIIRAENSNLKRIVHQLEGDLASSTLSIESLNKKIIGSNAAATIDNSKGNINININDISNANLIINDTFASPAKKKNIRKDYGLSTSHSNRNVLFGMYKELFSPSKVGGNAGIPPKMLINQFNYSTITHEKGSNHKEKEKEKEKGKRKTEKMMTMKNSVKYNEDIYKRNNDSKREYRRKFIASVQMYSSQQQTSCSNNNNNNSNANTIGRDSMTKSCKLIGNETLREHRIQKENKKINHGAIKQ